MSWIVSVVYRNSFWIIALTLGTVLGAISVLIGRLQKKLASDNLISALKLVSKETVFGLLKKYGNNSHAFLSTYSGFHYYSDEKVSAEGVIAFVNTTSYWIGGADPIAPVEEHAALLESFAKAAESIGKKTILIPVSSQTAELAKKKGFGVVMIGCEPKFDLTKHEIRLETVNTAKQAFNKGFRVRECPREQITANELLAMDAILKEWIDMRNMPPFQFMNQVEPWLHSEKKRYFICENKNHISAFIAAIPYKNGQGWYFIDVLRRSDSITGTTELLILESMRLLKNSGEKEVSLGVAALAGLDMLSDESFKSSLTIQKILKLIHDKGEMFFRFKPLYNFKMKFKPSSIEPVYIVCIPPKFGVRGIFNLLEAFLRGGILSSVTSSLYKSFSKLSLAPLFNNIISNDVVVRDIPISFVDLLKRTKLTLMLLSVNIYLYFFTTDRLGHIMTPFTHLGFSLKNIEAHPLLSIIMSPFLHYDLIHVNLNIVLLILFCGSLELIAGTFWMFICYSLGMLFSNPLTIGLVFIPLKLLGVTMWQQSITLFDVGASLGIFACAGGLANLLRNGLLLMFIISAIPIGLAINDQNLWQLNHIFAVLLGYFAVKYAMK